LILLSVNNNNNNEIIYIARTLKTSDALMAHSQTNNVLVYVRMYAVTERGVVGRQVDCSILSDDLTNYDSVY